MDKILRRERRRKSIRKKLFGTSERPRLCVDKSNRNLSVQMVDDITGKTIIGISTLSSELGVKEKAGTRTNVKFASMLGKLAAKMAAEKGIKKVVFDRAGYQYHGVVKAVADAAREGGLEF